ncbi:MAG: tRNA (guanine-N7-)-methyltransferase [Verrucomicrobiales bacterium]|jgi:tRNA (guanine-N7-)-methyltransferase
MVGEQRDVEKHEFVPRDYFEVQEKEALFPGERPMELDIGCGDGRFLLAIGAQHPERDFLGVERLLGRMRKVCRKVERQGLENVRVLRLESSYALECLLPPASFSRLHVLFPDPWPKARHHERRIVRSANLGFFARVLAPGGEFLFKTDHEPYHVDGTEAIRASGLFEEVPWEDDAFFYPRTDFEEHWLGQGKAIYRSRFRKIS